MHRRPNLKSRMIGAAGLFLLAALTAPVAHAQSTLQRVASDGKITVGIYNAYPWGYKAADGQVSGFSPDLVREALAPLGVKQFDFVVSDFGALIPGLNAHRFDVIAAGLYITPVRCQSVAFGNPDLTIKDAVIVKQGNPLNIHSYKDILANPKIRLGIARGMANIDNAKAVGVPQEQIQLFPETQSTAAALATDRVDAIAFSAPTVIGLLADKNYKDVERAIPFTGLIQENGLERAGYSALAFRLDDKELRDAYNKRLAEMIADGSVAKIMKKYGFTEAENPPSITQEQICAGQG